MQRNSTSLLNQIAAGDEQAFRQLFEQYSHKVFVFALRLTRSQSVAEEIVQDVFLKIWLHRQELISITYFPSYLYTITRNHSFNILKKIGREVSTREKLGRSLTDVHNETEEAVIYHDYQNILTDAINRLPPQQRLVYSLCHLEGFKYEEVARQLKISRLTVKTHMQQAIRSIKSRVTAAIGLCISILTFI
jgi:RNA polymerase sigma-70 factor (family 1)